MTSGAWREEALLDAGLVGIDVPISHLIFREWRGEVLEKMQIPYRGESLIFQQRIP